ncbi:PspA-associated protein PspAB [Nocardioides coralli]|uniref:PspA-associated protein PspAB n=1 Tax=Nocardioides coralli TaxID=2872154 RepID=UPI001CA38828|nr:hypothetical protein [Nocardioides coralli]QZY28050.1 hypothetical protein K6T13_11155 [Nocardioides coralli]
MGLWEAITGRRREVRPDLDALFGVPGAAITLQTATGFTPTGSGSVCYRAATGTAFAEMQSEVIRLIESDPDAPEVSVTADSYGFTWLTVTDDPDDVAGLCTDLHAVNTSLEAQGFGTGLLCSLIPFSDRTGRRLGLVYLYKQGTFYPFAPTGPQQRDNLLEMQVRDTLSPEIPVEKDLSRWLAVWDAPGL